ncbi:Xaa-Pro dipeptidase [Vanrija pseudolonga]|uniref:Xaa-Pro dipeptidase n=1 Tax=Vanrija pseudolonga TaxID=143232 RepID=A0AAF0Y5M1_9TREE|nr:Xaa-Pro dipeptidase [Vanrija pseudolonga]
MTDPIPVRTEAEQTAYAAGLREAERKAMGMFDEIEGLIKPGVSEKALSDAIHQLGLERHGLRTHWHKRVVRSGENTLAPFEENPPDRVIQADDILIVDLGPVFEAWEADFGRTYVVGNDPEKIALRDALEPIWVDVKAQYDKQPGMSGEQLYAIAVKAAQEKGYDFGAPLAGHIVGSFPHERIPKDKITLYISEGNSGSMISVGKGGYNRHWILEIHLRDKKGRYQGFYEQLLSVN